MSFQTKFYFTFFSLQARWPTRNMKKQFNKSQKLVHVILCLMLSAETNTIALSEIKKNPLCPCLKHELHKIHSLRYISIWPNYNEFTSLFSPYKHVADRQEIWKKNNKKIAKTSSCHSMFDVRKKWGCYACCRDSSELISSEVIFSIVLLSNTWITQDSFIALHWPNSNLAEL